MATITEDYVSFETAKLLIKKGFDFNAEYESYYTLGGVVIYFKDRPQDVNIAPRITLQMAMKWLREVHKLIPIVLTGGDSQNSFYYWFRIDRIIKGKLEDAIYREDEKEFSSYEAAAEAAIKYCLENLI